MVRIEHEVTIDRPPSDVFAYVIDIERAPEWQATALEAQLESERMEKGPARSRCASCSAASMETTLEVVESSRTERFAVEVVSGR